MNTKQLQELEFFKLIEIFQNAVIAQTVNETPETTHRLTVARENLSSFILNQKRGELNG